MWDIWYATPKGVKTHRFKITGLDQKIWIFNGASLPYIDGDWEIKLSFAAASLQIREQVSHGCG